MWIILKNAEEVTETYKKLAELTVQIKRLDVEAAKSHQEYFEQKAKIAGLEFENETLLREVEHWKSKAQFNKNESNGNTSPKLVEG